MNLASCNTQRGLRLRCATGVCVWVCVCLCLEACVADERSMHSCITRASLFFSPLLSCRLSSCFLSPPVLSCLFCPHLLRFFLCVLVLPCSMLLSCSDWLCC